MISLVQKRNDVTRRIVSITVFCLILPGFFVYNWLQTFGLPPVLGGYFILMSMFCVFLTFPAYLISLRARGASMWIDLTFWSTMVFGILWVLMSSQYVDAPIQNQNYLGTLIAWISLYMFAYIVDFSDQRVRKTAFWSLIIMSGIVLTNLRFGIFHLGVPDMESGYQFFALIYLIVFYTFLSNARSQIVTWTVTLLSTVTLVFIGARSELAAMMIAVAVFINIRFFSIRSIAIQIIAVVVALSSVRFLLDLERNRVTDLVLNGARGSRGEREWAHNHAVDVITKQPVLGDYANYPPGLYSHDALSIYVDFGLLGFVLYLLMILTAAYHLMKHIRSRKRLQQSAMGIALFIQLAILLYVAKAGVYYLIPFALGYTRSMVQKFECKPIPASRTRMPG